MVQTLNRVSRKLQYMPRTDKRKRVRTSAPEDQIEIWEKEADEMNVTRAEYMRTMIQAGRRNFGLAEPQDTAESDGIDVEERVIEALEQHGELSWDELLEIAVGDVEEEVESTINTLEENDRVQVSLRNNSVSLR